MKADQKIGRREIALACVAFGGIMVAGVPLALALFGTPWRVGRLYYSPIPRRPGAGPARMIHQQQEQLTANN
jgi:hypothetical protein